MLIGLIIAENWHPSQRLPLKRTVVVDEDSRRFGLRPGESPRRIVIDGNGRKWLVYEAALGYDRRFSSLIFESDDIVRRFRDYPAEWATLSVAELVRLGEAGGS